MDLKRIERHLRKIYKETEGHIGWHHYDKENGVYFFEVELFEDGGPKSYEFCSADIKNVLDIDKKLNIN